VAKSALEAVDDPDALRDELSRYLKANRYSLGTLRLTKEMDDVIHPDRFLLLPSVVGSMPLAKDEKDQAYAVIEADRYRFAGSDALPLRFRVYEGHEAQTPVTSVTVERARLIRVGAQGPEDYATLDFSRI